MAKNTETKKQSVGKIITAAVLLLLANYLFFLMLWLLDRYDKVQFDQILYQVKSPIAGTNGGILGSAMISIFLYGTIAALIFALLYLLIAGIFAGNLLKIKKYMAYSVTRVAAFFKKRFVSASVLLLLVSLSIFIFRLEIHSFVANSIIESDFIEDNYVSPDDVELTFPEQKRNLVYIFLESTENTFSDTSVGGKITEDFMPELTELKNNNVSFSGKGGKGGAYAYVGTTWTAAAMFTQTAGINVKVPINFDFYGRDGDYMPGIVTLGDVLKDAGYTQTLLVGSDADFAARKTYFTEHGNYNIIDVYSLIEDGKLPEDYWEWWGFEDEKLFAFAKEELSRLAATGEPFNFTTLTADSHFPDGYECSLCGDEYEEQYSNVLRCTSKQVYEFVSWIQAQPFYENTTIILSGDHLTMDPEFLADIDEDYIRTTYNCIINAPIEPVNESEREFGTFDMFPTTLAALGVEIEGDRLGLGVNLFSREKTLTEEYGFEYVEEQLQKRSEFYFDNFYGKKEK